MAVFRSDEGLLELDDSLATMHDTFTNALVRSDFTRESRRAPHRSAKVGGRGSNNKAIGARR